MYTKHYLSEKSVVLFIQNTHVHNMCTLGFEKEHGLFKYKSFYGYRPETLLWTRFLKLFDHNWPLMNALDLLRKALILTFEGAGLGIGPKTWKDRPWPKWAWIIGNIRVPGKCKEK